jgi:NAD(P)-dependent dehydrogenase (short-subunit alcohol dehydrogenase family)
MKPTTKVLYAANVGLSVLACAAAFALRPRRVRRGRVVLITGGSRGLGLALAHRFGRAGAKLVLAARNQDELEGARRALLETGSVEHEDDILLVACDVSDEHQAAGLVDLAVQTFGQLDTLINNAGIIEVGPVEHQPVEAFRRAMETNYFAAVYTSLAAMPHMLGRGEGQIVSIASIGGKVAVPHMLPYSASKFALVGFSEGLHAELRGKGVRVTTVCPGLMRTGGEVHAHFTGQVEKEEAWFQFSAKTPVLSASAEYAAKRIFRAVAAGRAEITITPQAWLAARFAGMAPETTQRLASLVNEWLLPRPNASPVAADAAGEMQVARPVPELTLAKVCRSQEGSLGVLSLSPSATLSS